VTRKATTAAAIQTTPRIAFNRLSSFTSMSRRALLVAAALLFVVSVAATFPRAPRRRAARSTTLTLPILMYHRIGRIGQDLAPITQRLSVTPDDFSAQMRWLKGNGFHAVTQRQAFDALEHGAPLPAHPIMVTFDDGYRGVWANALPVLVRLHMSATAYVITSRISNGDPSFLTWGQLRVLERHGVTIGSHTVTHPDLTALSDLQAFAELRDSRHVLEQHLGRPVRWFAYPAGREDARVRKLVHRAGYLLAVTTQPGAVQSSQTPLELRRYEVLDATHVTGLAALLAHARG
jgi:peptidoglycan/xylan/chitin deacetylase (PgdA/CDA1 family)